MEITGGFGAALKNGRRMVRDSLLRNPFRDGASIFSGSDSSRTYENSSTGTPDLAATACASTGLLSRTAVRTEVLPSLPLPESRQPEEVRSRLKRRKGRQMRPSSCAARSHTNTAPAFDEPAIEPSAQEPRLVRSTSVVRRANAAIVLPTSLTLLFCKDEVSKEFFSIGKNRRYLSYVRGNNEDELS